MPYCQQCGTPIGEHLLVCAPCSNVGVSHAPALPAGPPAFPQQRPRFQIRYLFLIVAAAIAVAVIMLALGARKGISSVIEQAGQEGIKQAQREQDAKAITEVMRQDQLLANAMNTAVNVTKIKTGEDFDRVAALMKSYVDQARQINTNACPRDFAEAYFRHISAWSDEAETVKEHPHFPTQDEAFVEGFFRWLAGDPGGAAADPRQEVMTWLLDVKGKDAAVHKSWEEVQAVAVRDGVSESERGLQH